MSKNDADKKLNLTRQLRPLRLAFIVPPNDPKLLRTVLETNTCLWGGVQNPIIAMYGQRPRHWENSSEWPGGVEYARGLLDGFEPDFIVEAKKGLTSKLNLPERRVIALADILNQKRDPHIGYGVSVVDVLRHAYDEDLKFVRRQKLKAVWSSAEARPTLFEAAVLGAYPESTALRYFKRAFIDAFEPEAIATSSAAIFDALTSGPVTPLRATQYGLEFQPGAGWRSRDAVLFLLNPDSIGDVIDFWNLRAWGVRCFPIPAMKVNDICAAAIDLISRENTRVRGTQNSNIKHQTTLLKARSVPSRTLEEVEALLQPRPYDSLLLQHWMPRLWQTTSRASDVAERGELVASRDNLDVALQGQSIRFDLVEPIFNSDTAWAGLPCWANTVALRDFSSTQTGLVYPLDGAELAHLLRTFSHNEPRALKSGIAVISTGSTIPQRWEIPDGQAVVQDWFSAQKLLFRPSAAGKTAVEVARSLRGLQGLRVIDSVELLKCLDRASGGSAILQHQLLGLLKRVEEHPEAPRNLLRSLVELDVLRLGILLSCPACDTEGWFALEELGRALRCGRCLRTFEFPSSHPPNNKWAYRTQGPFALPGYAHGAYATLLALRCLGPSHNAEMTWFPGCEVGPEDSKYELDFVAFLRTRWHRQGPARVLMGECKTFDKFKPKEVRRFREVAKRFPGTIRVFATLRQELDNDERTAIASLAREGRRLSGSQSPVLVLTAAELLSTSPLPYCYRDAGPRFERFKNYNVAPMAGDDGLLGLCDLTQQIHLGMEPTWSTIDKEIDKRRARRRDGQASMEPAT